MLVAKDLVTPHGLTPGFSLTVEVGAVVGLVGPNGAGKSTLLRALAGAMPLRGGQVVIEETDLGEILPSQRAKKIAHLPQLETPPAGYSVRDIVALGRYAHRRGLGGLTSTDQEAIEDALTRMALTPIADRRVDTLSGGEYQRVRVARALTQGAPVLLLDEPVAHLDPGTAARLLSQVVALCNPSRNIMVAALHDLNLAALFCTRLIMLDSGSIVADGSPAEVLTETRVRAVYGEACVVVPHPEDGVPQVMLSRGRGTLS